MGNIVYGEETQPPWVDESNPFRLGLTGGIMMELPLGPLSLGAEVLYTQKGEKYTWSYEEGDVDYIMKADYIEVPVMAKLSLLPMMKVYGGLSMGFLVTAEAIVEVDGDEVESMDMKDFTSSTEMGAIMGVQVKVSKLVFDARYNHGLTDIVKDNEGDAVQLRTLYATVGFMF